MFGWDHCRGTPSQNLSGTLSPSIGNLMNLQTVEATSGMGATRKRIALGATRGLLYHHEQCDPKIIHRDMKAANILLDDYCEAIVGDFGLAKLLDHGDSHITTAVRGIVGYIAPGYLSTGQSSEKTDVFGFGILLIELITSQRALEFGKAANQKSTGLGKSTKKRSLICWWTKIYTTRMIHLSWRKW